MFLHTSGSNDGPQTDTVASALREFIDGVVLIQRNDRNVLTGDGGDGPGLRGDGCVGNSLEEESIGTTGLPAVSK